MKFIFIVGMGSFIGGGLRYISTKIIQDRNIITFPLGTLSVNIIGCFFIGLLWGITERKQMSDNWQLFLITGLLGGFTTFSTFSKDSLMLLRNEQITLFFLYLIASVLLGILSTWLGFLLIK